MTLQGTVLWGANNIFSVRAPSGEVYEHIRIKGKVLPGTEGEESNPLAPGDLVMLEEYPSSPPRILQRIDRRNIVHRWNRKRRRRQAIAANVDILFVVTSPTEPPYRSGFVDRVLVMAELEGIPAAVVLNKADLEITATVERHLAILCGMGYAVYRTVAHTDNDVIRPNPDIERLRDDTAGRVTVLVGRSGVGKSSLINHLVPAADLATAAISRKYRRGRHTTTLARQVVATDIAAAGTIYIDTPGVREFDLVGYSCPQIAAGYRDFLPFLPDCRMPGCTHLHEPDCAVRNAVDTGSITRERYESYATLARTIEEELR